MLQKHQMGQAYGPRPVNYRRHEVHRVNLGESPDAAPERLDETSLLKTHRIGQGKDGSSRDVPLRHDIVLRKAAGVDVVAWEIPTHSILSPSAKLALLTPPVGIGGDPVAG